RGRRDDLQLAVVRSELEHGLPERGLVDALKSLGTWRAGVDVLQSLVESPQVVTSERRDDVDAARELLGSLKHSCDAADYDVLHPVPVEGLEDSVRIELRALLSHAHSLSRAR